MTPAFVSAELLVGVLCIVNQKVRASAVLNKSVEVRAVVRQLIVRHKDYGPTVLIDAESARAARMDQRLNTNPHSSTLDAIHAVFANLNIRVKRVEGNGKDG